MFIPANIKLFEQTIKVKYSRTLIDKKGAFAIWDYNTNTITIQQSTRNHPLTQEQIEGSLVHEVTHAFLDLTGNHKLSENEVLVSSLSNLIHQFIMQIH